MNTELAICYNNISVLESLSVDIALGLLEKHQIINNIDHDLFKKIILATDMSFHYDLLAEAGVLEDIISTVNLWDDDEQDSCSEMDENLAVSETLSINVQQQHLSFGMISPTNYNSKGFIPYDENINSSSLSTLPQSQTPLDLSQRLSFACILLHAADISNTVRSWPISKQWSDLIVQEFFRQGDAEKLAGLQVSPGMDRDLVTQPSISLKFGDFVVKPYFEALAGLLPRARVFVDTLQENREEWLRLKASPFSTSITNYFNGYLTASRFPPSTSTSKVRKVNVPAGTVAIPSSDSAAVTTNNSSVKPMPILRTTSHSSVLLSSPHTSVSSELRRNSADHRKRQSRPTTTTKQQIQI